MPNLQQVHRDRIGWPSFKSPFRRRRQDWQDFNSEKFRFRVILTHTFTVILCIWCNSSLFFKKVNFNVTTTSGWLLYRIDPEPTIEEVFIIIETIFIYPSSININFMRSLCLFFHSFEWLWISVGWDLVDKRIFAFLFTEVIVFDWFFRI